MLKIYGRKSSSNVQKVLWCCDELGIAYRREDVGGKFGKNRTTMSSAYAEAFVGDADAGRKAANQMLLMDIPISVGTDKTTYDHNDKIIVHGKVANVSGFPVTLTVVSPLNSVVTIAQIEVDNNGNFETTLSTEGGLWKHDGTYTIKVNYGTSQKSNKVLVELTGEASASSDKCSSSEIYLKGDYCVPYSISGGTVTGASINNNDKSIIVKISADEDGTLTLSPEDNPQWYLYGSTLIDQDFEGNYIPDLARSWTTSDDGLVWTFSLAPEAKWSDWEPVTADDVVFSLLAYRDWGDFGYWSSYATYIADVQATDEHTVVVTLSEPIGNMESQVLFCYILPKHIWGEFAGDLDAAVAFPNEAMVGSGPFRLIEFVQDQYYRLEAVKDHYGRPPAIDGVTFTKYANQDAVVQALRAGEVDMITELPATVVPSLRQDDNITVGAGTSRIGHSLLESGDAPMGVAFGAFEPAPGYEKVREFCKANQTDQSCLQLSVQTESGQVIPCAGVGILEHSGELALSYAEVNVLGIPYPLYEQLFPQHVQAYEQQFK